MNATDSYPVQTGRSARVLSLLSIACLCLCAIVAVAWGVSTWNEITLLERLRDNGVLTATEVNRNEARQGLIRIAYMAVVAVASIPFIAWMYWSSKNIAPLRGYDARYQRYSPFQAVVWWFVPIAWYWMPYKVMREIWRESLAEGDAHRPPLLVFWWAAWIMANIVGNPLAWSIFEVGYTDIHVLIRDSYRQVASAAIMAIAAILAMLVVRTITVAQEHGGQRQSVL